MARYEKSYEEAKLKAAEEEKAKADKERDIVKSVDVSKPDVAEQDLDVFLLGDVGDSDDGAGMESLEKHIAKLPLFSYEYFTC